MVLRSICARCPLDVRLSRSTRRGSQHHTTKYSGTARVYVKKAAKIFEQLGCAAGPYGRAELAKSWPWRRAQTFTLKWLQLSVGGWLFWRTMSHDRCQREYWTQDFFSHTPMASWHLHFQERVHAMSWIHCGPLLRSWTLGCSEPFGYTVERYLPY